MNTLKESAIIVLQESDKPLHYKEITRIALEKWLFETSGKTPEASINSQIVTDIKNKWSASDFIKIAPSTYWLNTQKSELPVSKKSKIALSEINVEEKEKIETGFTWKAWEHLVCSELLFRWYNASIMSVDVWMDIVATKWNNLISIQVKTSNINSYNTYIFDVRKVSFERHTANNTYYIFVLRGANETNFLILPNIELERKINENTILPILKRTKYRINVKIREWKIYLGNLNNEVNYYLNNRDIIR